MMTVKPWTSFNVSTLLAWLDFCLQNGIDFESTILQRLKEATEQHPGHVVGFTIQQVKNKLISLGRGRKDVESALDTHYPGLREIISKGSVCIPGLARELRLEIAGAIERFRISYARSQPTIHPAQPLGGQDSPKERSSTQSDRHDGHIRQNLDKHGTPRACPNVTPSSPVQGPPSSRTLGGRTLTPNGHSHSDVSTSLATPSHSRKTIHIRGPRKDGRPWQHFQPLDADNDEAQRLNSLWEAEVTTLYGKIEDLEKRNERLVAGQQIFDNARQKSESSGQDPQESQFRTYLQQLWNLDQLNMNLQNNARFFELDPTQKRSLQAEDIDNTIDKIQSKLQSILDSCDTASLQLNTAIHPGSDSEALLLSSLDLHHTPQDIEPRLKECISQFEVPVIVRTLALAALQDWVFNTSFPPFMGEGATSSFLKSLEEVIMDHADWAWLRNLETAAYSRFLEKFKIGLLPMRSRLLADRLIKVIATFLIPGSLEETGIADGPKALDNILDLDSLHFELIDMFSAGLEFKAAAGGSDNRYEFIVNPLKIEQTRKAESSGSSQICTSRSWNYASLRVYDAGTANWLDPRSDAIIQTNNFVPGLSRTKSRCIYSRDISNEGSETALDGSTLQTHNPFSASVRSQRRNLSPTTSVNQSNNLGAIHSPHQRIFGRSNRPTSFEPIDDRPEQCRIDCFSSKQISHPEGQLDKDDDSLSTISSVRDPFEVEINTMRVELESTVTEKPVDEQGADVASKHERSSICCACGTELSSYDSMLRHQKNKSCRRCIICEEVFPTSSALKKHQEIQHSISNKRRRLSQDHHSTELVNSETTEPNKKISCERCGQEFNKITSLQRHTVYKSCLHCYKCSEEFDRASDCSRHMKSVHGLQFIDSRWRRINLVQQVEGEPDTLSKSGKSEGPGSTTQDDHERVPPETRILPPSTCKHAQAGAAIEADIDLGNTANEVTTQKSSQAPMENGNHCASCDEWFSNLFSFERHQERKRHRDCARKFKTESAVQRQYITPKSPKNVMANGTVQDGVSKSRVENRPRSRASTEMRREPTPESRHIARIIAELRKADENTPAAITSSQKINQAEDIASSMSHRKKSPSGDSAASGVDCKPSATEQTQVLKAPVNFGKKWSAPPRTFENLTVGASSSPTKPLE